MKGIDPNNQNQRGLGEALAFNRKATDSAFPAAAAASKASPAMKGAMKQGQLRSEAKSYSTAYCDSCDSLDRLSLQAVLICALLFASVHQGNHLTLAFTNICNPTGERPQL